MLDYSIGKQIKELKRAEAVPHSLSSLKTSPICHQTDFNAAMTGRREARTAGRKLPATTAKRRASRERTGRLISVYCLPGVLRAGSSDAIVDCRPFFIHPLFLRPRD